MTKYFNQRLNKNIVDISPGEFFVSSEPLLISTILGSCISVAFFDSQLKMGGLNHFMLVEGRLTQGDILRKERYGLYAMESLLNEFYKRGSKKVNLSAKIFGGAKVIKYNPSIKISREMNIGDRNAEYARSFLKNEEIPLLADDTGGEYPRRLYLEAETFKVFVKKTKHDPQIYDKLIKDLEEYKKKLDEKKEEMGKIILF